MSVLVGALGSIAAAALFFLLEPYLIGLKGVWRFVGAGLVFFAAVALAAYMNKKIMNQSNGLASSDPNVLTDNEAAKDLSIDVDGLDATKAKGKVIVGNKAGGKATINVKNSKF